MKPASIDLAPEEGMLRSAKSCGIALSVLLLMQSGCSCGCSRRTADARPPAGTPTFALPPTGLGLIASNQKAIASLSD